MIGVQLVRGRISEYVPLLNSQDVVVEIMDLGAGADEVSLSEMEAAYRPLRDRLFSLHAPYLDQCLCSCDSTIRQYSRRSLEQALTVADGLEIRRLILHHSIFPTLPPHSDVFGRMADSLLDYLNDLQARYGVEFCLENTLDVSPDVLTEIMIRNTNKQIGICFDVAHAALSKVPLSQWITQLSPWIRHVHINDSQGVYDDHLPCGTGVVDWSMPILKELVCRRDIVSIIEVASAGDARDSMNYLDSVWGMQDV